MCVCVCVRASAIVCVDVLVRVCLWMSVQCVHLPFSQGDQERPEQRTEESTDSEFGSSLCDEVVIVSQKE